MSLPVYAPSTIQFDAQLLKDEISEHLLDQVLVNAIPTNPESLYSPSFEIAGLADIRDTTHAIWNPTTGERQYVKKAINSYETINLTYLPNIKESGYRNSFVENGKQIFFREYDPKSWRWREDLKTPYIRQVVEQLGFSQVTQVTCIIMRPPAIGLVHRDIYSNKNFYKNGFGSLSIIVTSGGAHLVIDVNGQRVPVKADGSIYHFDDSFMHGLTRTQDVRYAYRIFGLIDREKYLSHLDLTEAIWSD